MSQPQFQRDSHKALMRGIMTNSPVDLIKALGYFPILINTRSYAYGQIEPRYGMNRFNASAMADLLTHSIRRLNNDLATATQAFTLIVGAGTGIYNDDPAHLVLTLRESGFSGNPLSLNAFRPDQSPEPWMFIADANKLRKMRVDGTIRNWGIAPPTLPPTGPGGVAVPALNSFQFTTIDSGIGTAASWTPGDAVNGPIWKVTNATGPTDTSTSFLFDAGTTGWASIGVAAPTDTRFYQEGFEITLNGAGSEVVIIDSTYKAVKTTTVQSITYDSGTTGLCTIQPTAHKHKAWVKDALFQVGTEYVRVLSVTFGDDGIPSIRCSTVSNHTAAETITGILSFRVFTTNNHAAGATFTWSTISMSIGKTPAGELVANTPRSVGMATRVIAIDLSSVAGRPLQDDDQLNFIIYLDDQGLLSVPAVQTISEVQIQLDCGNGSFTQDYFYIALRPSDFSGTATGTSTAAESKQQKVARGTIDDVPIPVDTTSAITREGLQRRIAKALKNGNTSRVAKLQEKLAGLPADGGGGGGGGTGDGGGDGTGGSGGSGPGTSIALPVAGSTYVPVRIKVKDVTRFGTNFSKGWADINSIRVRVLVSNSSTASVFGSGVGFGSFWIGGAFGPTVDPVDTPYIYRYRWRSSLTGTRSNPSPSTRSGVTPRNQRVQLVGTTSSDAQADKMDWFRFGGTLNEWLYIGTGPNSTATFNDDFPDDTIVNNPSLEFNLFQPFPVLDTPRTGLCNISGSAITRVSGDNFNTSWAPGTQIIANNVPYTIYSVPSTSLIHIVESGGTASGVSFFLPSPFLQGQPLPSVWGPYGEGVIAPRFFGCGATNEPGILFWTNGSNPPFSSGNVEAADVINRLEVTSPSEPLMNGCLYDGRSFVFSNKRQFYALPNPGGASEFITQEVANSKGLFGRYALCVGPLGIYFASDDGIYFSEGGQPRSITNEDLYPLFPHDGQPGITVNGYDPPDTSQPNSWRLGYADGFVFFNYIGVSGTRRTLVYSTIAGGWQSEDRYTPTILVHYSEEGRGAHRLLMGGSDGRVYVGGGANDAGSVIACQVRYPADDQSQPFTIKVYGDVIFDLDAQGANVTCNSGYDLHSSAPDSAMFSHTGRQKKRLEINSGVGREALNIDTDISWSSSTVRPVIYDWLPSYLLKVDETAERRTDWEDGGLDQPKFWQGVRIHADTSNVAKSVTIQSDRGVNGLVTNEEVLSVRHNGESVIEYTFSPPFISHLIRLQPTDTTTWKLLGWQWIFEPDSPLADYWETQSIANGGWRHIKDFYISHISTADINLALILDDVTYNYTITHNSGVFKKSFLQVQAKKYKSIRYVLTSAAPFRLYKKACEVREKQWGSTGPYMVTNPFGEEYNLSGARV